MERMKLDYEDDQFCYTRLKAGRPLNETEEHFFCKNVAMMYLFQRLNCRYIATEVSNCWHMDNHINGYSDNKHSHRGNKSIIDVIGMTRKLQVYGIESKATYSDFKNGFCAGLPYTYLICPMDVIPVDEVPTNIGLIYVDIPKFHIIGYDEMYGVYCVKKPRKRIDKRFLKSDGKFNQSYYDQCVKRWLNEICYRSSVRNVFNRTNIPIYKKVWKF